MNRRRARVAALAVVAALVAAACSDDGGTRAPVRPQATAKFVRVSARKARLVADLIRGLFVEVAVTATLPVNVPTFGGVNRTT